ncbi:MAG: DUF2188 domain-containing protein [Ignavibacteriae bacterium]|nr:DUF2188 domain-containing protein [Ignavibacteriota bacterium]
MPANELWVVQTLTGWAVKRPNSERASSVHRTQQEAIDTARAQIRREGGGELIIKGVDGKIRSRDTVPPARDSFPPRG